MVKKIKSRQEVVRCDACKASKKFLYLSDFSYGERLVYFSNETAPAYVSLLEDEVYNEYIVLFDSIVSKYNVIIEADRKNELIINLFGITCDEIEGCSVSFKVSQRNCPVCGSVVFEKVLAEPESLVEAELNVLSHDKWSQYTEQEKIQLIFDEIRKEGLL